MKEKILIIPDVHTRYEEVEKIVTKHPDATKIITLGDWFDNWYDAPRVNRDTAKYVKSKLEDPRWVFLLGNHDVSYGFTSKHTLCSGYTREKADAINEVLDVNDWDKFDFFYWLDDTILCSHAGLHVNYVHLMQDNLPKIKEFLAKEEVLASQALRQKKPHWFYNVGLCRGGYNRVGGIIWCDSDLEYKPVPGITQIFGHTFQESHKPYIIKDTNTATISYNIDTAIRHYMVYEDKQLRIEGINGAWTPSEPLARLTV